jgi:signal transduction histidine kinase
MDRAVGSIHADSDRLQQIVWNLLSNAVKFTPPGGRVSVHVAPESDQVAIVIEDTGVGISREFLPHVLERFRQQDGGTTRRVGGLGLGLAIARNLVERHGGSITADSDGEGHGARVTVRLPVSSSADEPTTAGLQQAVMD